MKKYIKIIFFLLIFIKGFAQEKKISENEFYSLQEKVRSYTNSNIDSAFIISNFIIKSKNYFHKSFGYGAKSYLYQIKGDSIKSNECYLLSFIYLDKINPSKDKNLLKADLLNYGGLIDWKQTHYTKALEKFSAGKEISENVSDIDHIIKFNLNISLVNTEVENYKLAIKSLNETSKIIINNEKSLKKERFISYNSNLNYNLGTLYEKLFIKERYNLKLLDSAIYHYNKSVFFSKDFIYTKINSKICLANIYYYQKKTLEAEKAYFDALQFSKENNLPQQCFFINHNLGIMYFYNKNYNKSLLCFKKVDSIYNVEKYNGNYYLNSNYYQAKIYNIKKMYQEEYNHSKIFLDNFKKYDSKLNNEILEVNYKINEMSFKDEMSKSNKSSEKQLFYKKIIYLLLILIFLVLIFFLIKEKKDKRNANAKIKSLIEEFKNKSETNLINIELKNKTLISIDTDKEREILQKLKSLEDKLFYLNSDFTLQTVAKKIKTNTRYLSFLVNNHYGKSFSEYSNELKINYAINELINNPTYRKYSTQAIAESVGFKNAISFTKSFSKRTGSSPTQFTKRLNEEKI